MKKLYKQINWVMSKKHSYPPLTAMPYLEHAALEDDSDIQENWAILLSNMDDSRQSIQNHIFPYILSQLSKNEFNFLEGVFKAKRQRIMELTKDLNHFQKNKTEIERQMQEKKLFFGKN